MNKTISINISGFAFIIDETAYQRLQKYLSTIRSYFTSADGVDEIMTDIEIRIAEIFRERLDDHREVVDSTDVEYVISILGQPEAFIDEGATEDEIPPKSKKNRRRRLFRDPEHTTLGGVASGIAAYFGVDPVIIRLLFVLLTIGGFAGIPIYIILWIIMPEAKTAADKLEMRGEPVTAQNIGRMVSDSFENVKMNFSNDGTSSVGQKATNTFGEILVFAGKLLMLLLTFLVKAFAILLIIIAILLGIGFFAAISGFDVLHVDNESYSFHIVQDFARLIIEPDYYGWWLNVALAVAFFIPVIAILYSGIRLLFGLKHHIKGLGIGMIVLWVISLIFLSGTAIKTAKDFYSESEFSDVRQLNNLTSDTLFLDVLNDPYFSDNLNSSPDNLQLEWLKVENDVVYVGNPIVNVVEARDTVFEIAVYYSARGATINSATDRAENISYEIVYEENKVLFQPYFSFPKEDQFRAQKVYVEVRVPTGKAVHFSNRLDRVIYDVENTTHTYDRDMVGETWTMLSDGLTCLQCDPEKIKSRWR